MDKHHIAALDEHKEELRNFFNTEVNLFCNELYFYDRLSFDQKEIILQLKTSIEKLTAILDHLKTLNNGWGNLIRFLKDHGVGEMADKLNGAAKKAIEIEFFTKKIATFYLNTYTQNERFGSRSRHSVDEDWVDVSLEDVRDQSTSLNHHPLLSKLEPSSELEAALVLGDSGTGKTSLVKKIAHDWAKGETSFKLVLAFPLKQLDSLNEPDKFPMLQIAKYFVKHVPGFTSESAQRLAEIFISVGPGVLVCADGLDEITGSENNFLHITEGAKHHKLIVTSRPLADQKIFQFFRCQYKICLFDEIRISEFVQKIVKDDSAEVKKALGEVAKFRKSCDHIRLLPKFVAFACSQHIAKKKTPVICLFYDYYEALWEQKNSGNKDGSQWKEISDIAFKEYKANSSVRGRFDFKCLDQLPEEKEERERERERSIWLVVLFSTCLVMVNTVWWNLSIVRRWSFLPLIVVI